MVTIKVEGKMKKDFTENELEVLYQEFQQLSSQSEESFASYAIWIGVSYDNWQKICAFFQQKGVDLKELLKKETFFAKSENLEEENV